MPKFSADADTRVTALLVSRMLLNLQEVNQGILTSDEGSAGRTGDNGVTTSLNFARVVGSLGSAVSHAGTASVADSPFCEEALPHGSAGEANAPYQEDGGDMGKDTSV
ncbi:hypothetical protein BV20DRAFT_777519 [Pilatotrama ljubarskyi]|nr:hypothetical protein BV20DRAFT_777519 [Pilatotrama ljubarskyi]